MQVLGLIVLLALPAAYVLRGNALQAAPAGARPVGTREAVRTALRDGKHEVEKNYQPGQSAGSATTGQGGAQVWREALTPAEKAVLKRVFR